MVGTGAFESGSDAVFASFSENVFADEVGAPDIGRLVFGLCVESGDVDGRSMQKSQCVGHGLPFLLAATWGRR